jgi:pyruvate-ferredoxin/flavodoxin oxidoreductase
VPTVVEMQSEGGAAGAVHGALQGGGLATTFTASQGLLLMIPNMFKIAGELTPAVFHVAARAVATHALSIFGDHSDVMAARSTGFALLSSSSVQEGQDFAPSRTRRRSSRAIPFLHFFDGFRTSHETAKIAALDAGHASRPDRSGARVRHRAARVDAGSPGRARHRARTRCVLPEPRGGESLLLDAPDVVQRRWSRFAALTGRHHQLFEYDGDPDAERVIVIMGSAPPPSARRSRALERRRKLAC